MLLRKLSTGTFFRALVYTIYEAMFRNYLKTAWRSLIRQKSFAAINIFGLTLGLTSSLLILLWVQNERNMDAFHANGKFLYQIYERQFYDGKVEASYPTQGLLAEELKKTVPEIKFASGLDYASAPGTLSNFEAEGKISKMGGYFAGADFFRMFSFPLLLGKSETALNDLASIAISRKMAELFFGTPENAIGKSIRVENQQTLLVSAVFENLPSQSSLQFDFVRSWIAYVKENDWVHNWGNTSPATFIRLDNSADPQKVQARIKDFIYKYKPKEEGFKMELGLQSFPEKYLHSQFKNGQISGGRIEYVSIFTIVALFILAIACINFMNLSTAQSSRRAKEVGLRKAIGARRSALVLQFIGESILLALISTLFAVVLTTMILPSFGALTGKQIELPSKEPLFWLSILGLSIFTGLIAGSYPALFLASLNPVRIFRGNLKFNWESAFVRKGLVVFQFSLSIILIIGMMVIYRQMNYIQSKNIGYDRDNLIYLPVEGDLVKNYELFKEKARKMPGILHISKMRNSPTVIYHHNSSISWPGMDPNLVVPFADEVVGYDFTKTLDLKMESGRDFSRDFATDSTAYILNQTAVNKIGLENAVGKKLVWGKHEGKIIGVIKDFHFNSMHSTIEPLIIRLDEHWPWGTVLVRIQAGKTKQALGALEKIYKELNPKFPFTYQFSDNEFAKLYAGEAVISKLANYFALLATFISCLGLFGLATFTAAQRTKEIGVRKVLGASVAGIAAMLSKKFLKLVAIAMLIAFPISWYVCNLWLQNFAYKVSVDWWIFAFAGGATILIAMLTVSYQSIKAALMNPVSSLRSE